MASKCKLVSKKENLYIFEEELEKVNSDLSIKESHKGDSVMIEIYFEDDKEHTTFLENLIKRGMDLPNKITW